MRTAPSVDPCRKRSKGNIKKRLPCPSAIRLRTRSTPQTSSFGSALSCRDGDDRRDESMVSSSRATNRRRGDSNQKASPRSALRVRALKPQGGACTCKGGEPATDRRCHGTVRHIHRCSHVYGRNKLTPRRLQKAGAELPFYKAGSGLPGDRDNPRMMTKETDTKAASKSRR